VEEKRKLWPAPGKSATVGGMLGVEIDLMWKMLAVRELYEHYKLYLLVSVYCA